MGCLVGCICNNSLREVHSELANLLAYTVKGCECYTDMLQQIDVNYLCRMADGNAVMTGLFAKLLKSMPPFLSSFKEGLKSFYKEKNQHSITHRKLKQLLCNWIHVTSSSHLFVVLSQPDIPYVEGTTTKQTLIVNVDGLLVAANHKGSLSVRSHTVEFLRSLSDMFEIVSYSEL